MDRIHFMNTGSSDAILVESDGHFMLVDGGEDSDNPRGFESLNFTGYEDRVLDYILKTAADESGVAGLDCIIGTHAHSDHLGGIDTVISDERIAVKGAILKEYDESKITDYEVNEWDNKEVFEQTVNALERKGVAINFNPDSVPFKLGNFTVTLYNTQDNDRRKVGENDRSLGVLLELGGTRVFLAGDIDNKSGDENRIGKKLGRVDLLKVGHHSYHYSTTVLWLMRLKPSICVVTNSYERADKSTLKRIKKIAKSEIYLTGDENGIIADILPNHVINLTSDIHK